MRAERLGKKDTRLQHVLIAGLLSVVLASSAFVALETAFAANSLDNAASSEYADGDDATTAASAWSLDSNCIDCHSKQAKYLDGGSQEKLPTATETEGGSSQTGKTDSKDIAEESSQSISGSASDDDDTDSMPPMAIDHASSTCIDCHNDEEGLAKVHDDVDTVEEASITRLKKTAVDEQYCLSCHGSWEDLAELTGDSTVLTDANGTVVNPHSFSDVPEHADITCDSCHYMHKEKSAIETATALCGSCHHAGVYECYTCH